MVRRIRRTALVLAALVVVAFTTLVVLTRAYDAEVKAKLIGTLNGYLRAPVTVSRMDLTLIERFPQASIHLRDVLALGMDGDRAGTDTLLYAQDLYLEFSLWGMLRGTYTVDEVHGEAVVLRPALDSLGRSNWVVWKTDSTATTTRFDLDRVTLDDLDVRYRDARSGLDVRAASRHLALAGRFGGEGSTLKAEGDAALRSWSDAHGPVLQDLRVDLNVEMAFGAADGAFRITKGEVLAQQSGGHTPLAFTLELLPGDHSDVLDLRANGFGLGLADLVQLLPGSARRTLDRYGMDGEVDLALTYKGPLDPGPALSLGMKVRGGRMQERSSGVRFSAIAGECAIELTPQGDLSRLLVKGFHAQAASGSISGSWDMRGVKNAPLRADIKGDIALADLLRFARVDTLEQVSGRLIADAHVQGRLRDVAQLKPADLRALTISGSARLKDATLKMKGIRHVVSGLNTELVLDGNDAEVRALTCSLQGSDLHLSGALRNLMPYLLFDDQPLAIEARGSSPRVDLAALLRSDGATAGKDYALQLPALVQLDLQAQVQEMVFERFTATGITGTIRLRDRVLRASPVMFNTAKGGVLGSLALDARGSGPYPLTIDADVKDIDVKQLFAEFQEFGQSFITSQHLSGTATAQVAFASPVSPALQLDLDGLRCTVDIAIRNGGIAHHQPLIDVATYVKQNKLVAPFVDAEGLRDRLADVRFDRLENRIEIRDRRVIVPAMTVHNNVMDIELSGVHGFDDRIDHHLNFRLGDLLKKGTPDDAFGPVADDGTGLRIFLHMYGDAGAPQFENDGAMAARRRSEGIKEQTAELRSILHNELNPFKKRDDAAATGDPERPAAHFDVEFDADTARTTRARDQRKRGFGALFEERPEEKEVIEVEP